MRIRTILSALTAGMLVAGCAANTPSPQPTAEANVGTPTSPATNASPVFNATVTAEPGEAALEATTSPERPTFTVQRGEIIDLITMSGQIAQVEQGISFSEDGILKAVYVQSGDTVEEGQLLAELDNSALESQLSQAQAILAQDRRAISQAVARGQNVVSQAEIDLASAQTAFEEARRPAKPDELLRARAAVQQAQADLQTIRNDMSQVKNQALRELDTAVKQLIIVQELYGEAKLKYDKEPDEDTRDEFIKQRDALVTAEDAVTRARIAADTARSNEISQIQRAEGVVAAAQADLDQLLAGPDPFEVARAEQNVARARLAVNAARESAVPDPELAKQVARSEAEVERLSQQIAGRRLLAPISGQVTAIEAVPGMPVRAATPLMMVASPQNRELLVDATDGVTPRANSRLLVGQEVEITFSRYPGRTVAGVVTRVPGRATADAIVPESQYAISYDADDLDLDIGDAAQVSVVLDVIENALWLPPQAVRVSRDRAFVVVDQNGEDLRLEVETGVITAERVEIISGLEEGDMVLGEAIATR